MNEENLGLFSPCSLADKLMTRGPIIKENPFRIDENGHEVSNRLFDEQNSKPREDSKANVKTGIDPDELYKMYDTVKSVLGKAPTEDEKRIEEIISTPPLNPQADVIPTTDIPVDKLLFPEKEEPVKPDKDQAPSLKEYRKPVTKGTDTPEVVSSSLYDGVSSPTTQMVTNVTKAVTSFAENTKESLQQALYGKNERFQEDLQTQDGLYHQFDVTLQDLFKELENSDVLSSGQKAALLMKYAMLSKNILKERFDVTL